MLSVVDVSRKKSEKEISNAIREEWAKSKVIHVKGLDEKTYINPSELRKFYDNVVLNLGKPADLGEDINLGDRESQRSGDRWMEIRYDPSIENAYRYSSNAQPLHTDGSYIASYPNAAFIYCQANATEGGETVFIDIINIIKILKLYQPELYKKLTSTDIYHSRSGDERFSKIIDINQKNPKVHWNYYCISKESSDDQKRMCENLFNFLNSNEEIKSNLVPVALRRGEGVLWKDDETLHGRNGYKATKNSERFLWKTALEVYN